MSTSTIAIIILLGTILLIMTDRVPLAAVAMLSAVLMSLTGAQPLGDAYKYFGNTSVVFCGASMMVCNGLFQTGAMQKITALLFGRLMKRGERTMVGAFALFTGLVTGFTTNIAIAAMMVPIARSIAAESKGKVKAKYLLMPVGTMSTIGSPLSLSGAAAVAAAAAMIIDSGTEMSFFSMAPIALVIILASAVYYATAGYEIMKKSFDFEEPIIEMQAEEGETIPKWKTAVSILVFLLMVVGFAVGIWNAAIVSTLAVLALWLTGAVSVRDSLKSCDWNVLIVMAGVTSMANGLNVSGAGDVIANFIIGIMGGENADPRSMMIALGLIGWLLSQVMSNTAANTIVIPMAISMAHVMGVNTLYFCVPVMIATAIAITTPLASPTGVIVMQGGFRFRDFMIQGIPLSILCMGIMYVMVPIFFPM